MAFTLSKSRLALEMFSGMIAYSEGSLSKAKERIVQIDPPDPTGQKGRPRQTHRITTASGQRFYLEKLPEGTKPGHVLDTETERVSAPGKEEREEKPKKPEIQTDLKKLERDVRDKKISMEQAQTETRSAMKKMGEKYRELQGSTESEKGKKALAQIAEQARNFADKRAEAVRSDDRKQMAEAVDMLESIAGDLGEALEGIKEKSGVKEFIYKKAELSTAPWEGKISDIEEAVTAPSKYRDQSTKKSISLVYFEEAEDGTRSVYKPDGFAPPIPLTGRMDSLDPSVSISDREVAAFEVDRVLGFGLVPPTFKKESVVPEEERKQAVDQIRNSPHIKQMRRGDKETRQWIDEVLEKGMNSGTGADDVEGAAQYFIEDAEEAADYGVDEILERYEKDDNFRFNMQKLAVFDYITGATDRHFANFMVSKKGDVFAIDNGLNFTVPGKKDVSAIEDFTSVPAHLVQEEGKGKVDDRIVKQLQRVDIKQLKRIMEERGLKKETSPMLARLNSVVEGGRLPEVENDMTAKFRRYKRERAATVSASLELDPLRIMKETKAKPIVVEIISGSPKKRKSLGTFFFDGKRVSVKSAKKSATIERIKQSGVRGLLGKHYTMEDGKNFILSLPWAIHGSMVQAIRRQ